MLLNRALVQCCFLLHNFGYTTTVRWLNTAIILYSVGTVCLTVRTRSTSKGRIQLVMCESVQRGLS
jgi:uncharacterized membrane protein